MPKARVVESLRSVDPAQWDALFPGEIEGYDYLLAVEAAGIEGFRWRYVLVEEDGALLAAAPGFITEYALDTTLTGPGRRLVDALRRPFPRILTLGLACLGSPCTVKGEAGFAPGTEARRAALLRALLEAFEADAVKAGCSLFGLKDIVASDRPAWDEAARPLGYGAMASLPVATLDIGFADLDAYLASLTYATRKDMRRKLRTQEKVRIEVRPDADEFLPRIVALYAETRARAEMALEHLTADYFAGVPRAMGERALYVLYFQGDDLLAANLLLTDGHVLLDKYFVMDAERGRALNLYFLSWFTNVRLCIERGLSAYVPGQAAYENKLRLGCRLTRTSIYFRHRNPLVNAVMRLAAPLFAADPTLKAAA